MSNSKANFDKVYNRVCKQIENVRSVDTVEAYSTCMAHTRLFGLMVAVSSPSDDEFVANITELAELMIKEGLATRQLQAAKAAQS